MADPYTIANGEELWRARWRTGSGERDSKSGFLTEGDAVAHEEKMRTARRNGKPVRQPKTRMTIDDLWDRFWEEEVVVAKSRGTQYGYRDTYRAYIGPHIGGLKLRALIEDPQPLKRWRSLLARTKSKAVVDHASAVASSMLSFAAEEDLIPFNPLLALAQQG